MAANEQTILETAERLLAETGRIPTVEAVREALGGGSFSTISPALRGWRRQQQSVSAATVEIPTRVREALERATAGLWSAFRDEIEERTARARDEAENRAIEAESEREQALHEVSRLETTLAAAQAAARMEAEGLTKERNDAHIALAKAREDIATLIERTRQQEARITELAGKLDRTESEREQVLQDIARLKSTLAETQTVAKAEREALIKERDEARTVQATARENAAVLTERVREQEARMTELAGALDRAERERADLKAESARLQERARYVDELREQIKSLQDRFAVPGNQSQEPKISRTRKKTEG